MTANRLWLTLVRQSSSYAEGFRQFVDERVASGRASRSSRSTLFIRLASIPYKPRAVSLTPEALAKAGAGRENRTLISIMKIEKSLLSKGRLVFFMGKISKWLREWLHSVQVRMGSLGWFEEK